MTEKPVFCHFLEISSLVFSDFLHKDAYQECPKHTPWCIQAQHEWLARDSKQILSSSVFNFFLSHPVRSLRQPDCASLTALVFVFPNLPKWPFARVPLIWNMVFSSLSGIAMLYFCPDIQNQILYDAPGVSDDKQF